jgi:hypothetical protein
MKKTIILILVCLFVAAGLFAARTRAYTQQVSAAGSVLDNLQFPDVTCTSTQTAPGYVVNAYITTRPTEVISTLTSLPAQIRLYRFGNGTTMPYSTRIFVQFSVFATDWTGGETLHVQVINNNVAPSMTDGYDLVIPDNATSALTITTPVEFSLWPVASDTWNYTLNVNGPDGYAVTGPVNGTTDYVAQDNDDTETNSLLGSYTIAAAPAGFHWAANPIVVTALDFVEAKVDHVYNATIEFVLVADPDTYTYNLYINGPDGYAVTGPVAGTTDYMATDSDVNNLIGDYTIAAAPGGFHWATNPITVDATMFVAAKSATNLKAIQGSRTNGSKVNYVYNATIEFVLVADPVYYNVEITSNPVGAAIFVDGMDSMQVTPWTFPMLEGTSATYTVTMAGYTWLPTEYAVTNIAANMAQEFVGTPVGSNDYTDGVPTVVTPEITVTIVGGDANDVPAGFMPAFPNAAAVPIYQNVLQLVGAGPWTIVFNTTAPVGIWYSYIDGWHIVHNVAGTITFVIPVGGKDIPEVPIALGDQTLPVELSSFSAVLTAQNFVKLTWVSQSETGLLGYRVYRNDTLDQATAVSITPVMVPATNTSTTQNYSITDSEVAIGSTYYYWLESVDMGSSMFHGPVSVLVEGEVPPVLPTATAMSNAYPNPFRMNSTTTIDVRVKAGDAGTVTIYNILGQAVKTFKVTEGVNPLNWNGKDSKGNVCGSGIYFYKLSTNSMNQTKKMVIVK